jgi:hypothetical protein
VKNIFNKISGFKKLKKFIQMEIYGKKLRAKITLIAFILILGITMTAEARDIKLIVRGDDLGMTQGSLAAFEKAFNEGVLTCGSLLVAGPWFEGLQILSGKIPIGVLGFIFPWWESGSVTGGDRFFPGTKFQQL